MAKDVDLHETDGETNLATSVCKGADESQYSTLSVCGYGSVVFKQYLPYQYFPDLSLFSETCKVEEVSIASGLKIHTII